MLIIENSKVKAKSAMKVAVLGDDFVNQKILDGAGRVVGSTCAGKQDADTNTDLELIQPMINA